MPPLEQVGSTPAFPPHLVPPRPDPSSLTELQPLAPLPGANAGLWELRKQQGLDPLWLFLGVGYAGARLSHGHSWWGTKPGSKPQTCCQRGRA